MRRVHANELARYYQRLENIEKRKQENERNAKISFMVRVVRRLGLFRNYNNGRV
jgi:Tfp pilus assembly protein PilW